MKIRRLCAILGALATGGLGISVALGMIGTATTLFLGTYGQPIISWGVKSSGVYLEN